MWNLILVCLEILLVSMQDRCPVCAEHTIGSENRFVCTCWKSLITWAMWNLVSIHLATVLVLVQDRFMVYAKRTIGS
jgi:hypothetical protein